MIRVKRVGLNGSEEIIQFDDTQSLLMRFERGERVFTPQELSTYIHVQKGYLKYVATFKTHIGLWYKDLPSPPDLSLS